MTIEEYIKEQRERVDNMTLAQARQVVADHYGHDDMRIECEKAVQMLLDCAEEKINNNWIPVTERLPEEADTYEVTLQGVGELEGIDNEVAYATWLKRRKDWLYNVDNWKNKEVIAWKPLSKPYKAESEGNDDKDN